jgi:hypothetical protein
MEYVLYGCLFGDHNNFVVLSLTRFGGTLDIIPYGHKKIYEDKLGWGRGI